MDTVTPEKASAFTVPQEVEAAVDEVISHYPVSQRSAAGMILHIVQEHFGFINDGAIYWIAKKLDLQPINILELVTFYPMYRQHAPGKRHIRVCRTLSCAMCGSYEILDRVCKETGIDKASLSHHHPVGLSKDGEWSIEFVECLASCGSAPVLMIDDKLVENVTADGIPDLLKRTAEKAQTQPGQPSQS